MQPQIFSHRASFKKFLYESIMETKPCKQVEEVLYVDAQRNCAVVIGEKDVKSDLKSKHK